MKVSGLRRSREVFNGIVYVGRMFDKIRLDAAGKLPDGYNLGIGWDDRCCEFLGIDYEQIRQQVLKAQNDEEVLRWCCTTGGPTDREIEMWNAFVLKQGWKDDSTERLEEAKADLGFGERSDVVTWADLHDADEEWI